MGTARAPVVGSGSAPAWIWRVSKPHCSLMGRDTTPPNPDRTGQVSAAALDLSFGIGPNGPDVKDRIGWVPGALRREAGGGVAGDDGDAVLVRRRDRQIDEVDAVLV